MSILVTGGAGYIGSHTVIELINKKQDIIIVDNLSNSSIEALKRIEYLTGKTVPFYKVDLLNINELNKIFVNHKIRAVMHFAGLKSVGESITMPIKYYENNVVGTINLLDIMSYHGVKKMVFSSSATVYGAPKKIPIVESSALQAINPYGRTKLIIEEIIRDLSNSDKEWSFAILRYFNPIGAHSSGIIGEDPMGIPNNLVPFITQVAIGRLDQLKIYGDSYPTRDGTGVRDYIHVVDLAKGHLAALNRILTRTGVEEFNLGTGKGYSVLEIISAFEKIIGKKISYKIVGRRPGDVAISYADVSKAYKLLGWKAEKGILEMCMDSWRWQSNNPNGYNLQNETR